MKQHKLAALQLTPFTKGQLFSEIRETFDYALPGDWLKSFSRWCAENRPKIAERTISQYTVWVYPKGFHFGYPVTACEEVQEALDAYKAEVE